MRLVQIQLRPSIPFWFIDNIVKLNQFNRVSDFINVNSLTGLTKEIIDLSIRQKQIFVLDYNGNRVKKLDEAIYIAGDMSVSIEDTKEDTDEDLIPEMVSVTTSINNKEEKEEKEEKPSLEPSEDHIENAKILLERNGNTIKKMIRNIKQTDDNLMVLHASLKLEAVDKNRSGILVAIQNAIERY
jgi:hypothetical protein